ncbi:iron ABC transporter permease [Nonomuraea sp. NPDC050227]|uniref:iron ABC transporter permease n=1 Tax=Nonomuraea sp. NPDC050227 TaxID=3364360 RepID=UPI0037B46E13
MITAVEAPATPLRRLGVAGAFLVTLAVIAALAVLHLTQGTSDTDLFALDEQAMNVLVAARLPRLLAAVSVGVALGAAGALLQSVARNPLASPDTLAVSNGAYLAVVLAATFGLSLPAFLSGGLSFLGGLAAAALVLALSAGGRTGTTRLILAGSATALALQSATTLLMILFQEENTGLFAWGSGSLVQSDLGGVTQMAPVIVVAVGAAVALGSRLDILGLGDDTASVLGVDVRRLRLTVVVLAVLLSAAAVTVAGPVGFVGLCAPVVVRLLARRLPGLGRHRVLVPLSALAGVVVLLAADVALRFVLGAQAGVDVPPGVVTAMLGAGVLMWLARRHRDAGPARRPPTVRAADPGRAAFAVILLSGTALLVLAVVLGLLGGDTWLLLGDVANWLWGRTGRALTYVLDQRWPRVAAAVLAGAALAVSGAAFQAVSRNPLAEPGVLGITAGAGAAAVATLTLVPMAGIAVVSGAAGVGALAAFALVHLLAWRGGLSSDRLVLMGIGAHALFNAVTVLIIVKSDPWNTAKALTWLSGSTYGRVPAQLLPVVVALALFLPLALWLRRDLDLLALDEDTPRVLGVPLEPVRLLALGGAVLVTSTAVSAVGVVGFVGLVAPHAARALVGGRHVRLLPAAAVLGAVLVSLADTLGRTVIAPAQVPAGLVTSLLGTPYFVWLLWRSRAGGRAAAP